jgi:hypothetical protein
MVTPPRSKPRGRGSRALCCPASARWRPAAVTRHTVSRDALFATAHVTPARVMSASLARRSDPLTGSTGIRGEDCLTRSIRSSRSRGSRIARSRSRAISPSACPSASIASARRNPGRTVAIQSGRPAAGPPALERRHNPQPAAGLVVHDHHVAQPRADAPADPPGIVIAIPDLAVDARSSSSRRSDSRARIMALRGASSMNGVCHQSRVIQNVGKTSGMPSLMPCAPHRRDDRVASGPVCGRTGSPCGFRNDGVELRDLRSVNRKLIIRTAPMSHEIARRTPNSRAILKRCSVGTG